MTLFLEYSFLYSSTILFKLSSPYDFKNSLNSIEIFSFCWISFFLPLTIFSIYSINSFVKLVALIIFELDSVLKKFSILSL